MLFTGGNMYSVIIPCAGKGSRTQLNVNKLLYKVDGLHLIEYTLANFIYDPDFTEIILVVRKNEMKSFDMFTSNKIKLVEGGKTRQESVFNGLVAATNELIFVHDGARPLINSDIIGKCKDSLTTNKACVVGIPLSDSIKEYVGEHFKTVSRENKYLMQTPQCGYRSLLLDVFRRAEQDGYVGTDEVSLIERYSLTKIQLIQGSKMNFKVTFQEDFDVFKKLKE